ncbi:MAG: hypothetical protein H6745_33505 [Deltaproteobacteria bacterium]|nr:hypothetical protein [Deltaproteobacteria bacterium]
MRIPGLSGNHYVSATGDFQLGLVSESTAAGGTGLFAYYNRFRVPGCGDGVLDDSEGCDDGNVEDGDGCSGACRIELGHGVCDTDEDCVANGRCDAQTHLCVARCTVDGDCDDSNGCTTDSCNLETGVCQVVALAEGASCDDGDFCTSGTTCDAGGVCSGGVTISCSQPTVWTDCQEAVCDESLNMCVEQDRACALDRVYFFGVIRRSGGTLGSIRCWRDAGGIACDMDGNELLVGEPVCE